MHLKQVTLFAWVFFFCFWPSLGRAVPPGEEWFTLKSPNFRIHHTVHQKEFAQVFSTHLERALPILQMDLGWSPRTPIDIVVNDRADSANGIAASFPANRIELFPVAFDSESSLMDYYDWVEELAVHELTHIVANDSAFGFWKTLHSIFGNSVRPNALQPGWILEGLAVYEESRFTRKGRGRSVFTEALLRTAIRSGKFNAPDYLLLDRLNDGVFWWPEGNTRYLVGYAMQAMLERAWKQASLADASPAGRVSKANAGNWPYALNGTLREVQDKTWSEIWSELQTVLEARYSMGANPNSTKICQLTNAGQFTGGAVAPGDGWIYFIAHHPATGKALARMPENSPCIDPTQLWTFQPEKQAKNFEVLERLSEKANSSRVDVHTKINKIVYTDRARGKGGREFNDLYLYDLARDKSERLTFNLRAREPAFAPGGDAVIFVRNLADGKQALEIVKLEDRTTHHLFTSKTFERLSHPLWFENKILFSRHNNKGREELLELTLKDFAAEGEPKARIPLAEGGKTKGPYFSERQASRAADGTLYFSANYEDATADGARTEIYRLRPDAEVPERVTNTISGLTLWPQTMPDGRLLFSTYTINGFNLATVTPQSMRTEMQANRRKRGMRESRKLAQAENNEPSIKPGLHEYLIGESRKTTMVLSKEEEDAAAAEAKTKTAEIVPYSAGSTPATTLWPQYWIPLFSFNTDGAYIGAATSGQDALERHRYFLLGMYDTRAHFPIYNAVYANFSTPILLTFQASQANNYFTGSRTSNRFNYYTGQATIFKLGPPLGIGLGFQQRRLGSRSAENPFVYLRSNLSKNERANALAIAPNSGYDFEQYVAYFPAAQGEKSFWEYRPNVGIYIPGLTASHSVQLTGALGLSTNSNLTNNYYQGGGPLSGIGNSSTFVVRGYPEDTLFGQRITTINFAYTLPLWRVYRGWKINPVYLNTIGFRVLADGGSAIRIARYSGRNFLGFQYFNLGQQFIYGIGGEFLLKSTLAYYAPLEIQLGVHRGLDEKFGGETRFYFGLNTSLLTGI